ncbi:hypothetical protein AJ80_05254 [Polytolypa hystricis UAMH7299]|uniref:Uncharacterized protein n=1 Tax=Polytolypa hystricis (strain UAMH7299) TaxID=1447883 RepID=A0A2B7Y5E9_POLH7|nr:hypothetical protein AJ80_05254 [Polytolypa hystricis UAMH7299]
MGTTTTPKDGVLDQGLSEVYRSPGDPEVDIVFVHGLNGHPRRTWTTITKKPNDEVFWPKDLLPHALKDNNVRILTYGYDAAVATFAGAVSRDQVHNHAHSLAALLFANRNLNNALERPIIFICHSLGGLIVKRTLIHCHIAGNDKAVNHLLSIFFSTYGILFMGTPHNGSDLAGFGSFVQQVSSNVLPKMFFDSSPNLIQALKRNNPTLQNINDQFGYMRRRFRIYFFYEAKPMDLKTTKKFIVDESSAAPILDGVERMGINADHGAMARFENENSPGYEAVADAIIRYSMDAPKVIAGRWQKGGEIQDGTSTPQLPPNPSSESVVPTHPTVPPSPEPPSPREKGDVILIAPPGFHPNSAFFGMEKELEQLRTRLFNAKRRVVGTVAVLVYGGVGAGKSHLTRQYVFTNRSSYSGGIFWVDGRSSESRYKCFWEIAETVSLIEGTEHQDPNWRDVDKFVEKVRRWFESREDWLLVFDGITFDSDKDINEFRNMLPFSKNSNIIYTSVDRTLSKKQRLFEPYGLQVKPLSIVDARKLLYKDIGIKQPTPEQEKKATELVEYYECLPLAIHAIGHRLQATGKSIEKYNLDSHLTDQRLAEPYQGIMRDLQHYQHIEALNLINILSFFGHHVPVGLIQLGLKALRAFRLEVRTPDRGGASQRHIDNTFEVLIKYGLVERSWDPYPLQEQSPTSNASSKPRASQRPPMERGDSHWSQDTFSTMNQSSIDVVKVHTVVQGFCRDELRFQGMDHFYSWLIVATNVFCLSYSNALLRVKATSGPGLVKDYREYLTHAKRLMIFFPTRPSKLTAELGLVQQKLRGLIEDIEREIENCSPESSQESFRNQKSIFDRSSSSSSVPNTPTSGSSKFDWEDEMANDRTESPVGYTFPHEPPFVPIAPHLLLPPQAEVDHGYDSDRETETVTSRLSSAPSQTTEVPISMPDPQDEEGWEVVVSDRKPQKPKTSKRYTMFSNPLRRRPGRRNLGDYRPMNSPLVSVSGVHAEGYSRHPRDVLQEMPVSAGSNAVASLTSMHRSTAPLSRGGGGIRPKTRTPPQKENRPTYATVAAGKLNPESPRSLGPRTSSSALDTDSDTGGLQRSGNLRDSLTRSVHSDNGSIMRSKLPVASGRVATPPSRFLSRHPSRSSDTSSGSFPVLQDSHISSPPPLPYEQDIQISRLPRPTKGPNTMSPDQNPQGHGLGISSGFRRDPAPGYLPTGYSSQPMSRDTSMQSQQSLRTEPVRLPPKYSPSPDSSVGRRRRISPALNSSSGGSNSPFVDTRTAEQLMFGVPESAIDSAPATPVSMEAPDMSRTSSGPGMMVSPGRGLSRSLVEFSHTPSTQHLQFGQHDPFSIDDARRRVVQTPYPTENLMPTASNADQLQSMIDTPSVVVDDHGLPRRSTLRARSGSSPAQSSMGGIDYRLRR